MNAAKAFPEVVLELDRPRKATFNMRAMNALEEFYEEKTGESQLWKALDLRALTARDATRILWACLLTDADDRDEVLTFAQVEKIATLSNLLASADQLMVLVEDLIERAMPVLDAEELQGVVDRVQKKTMKAKIGATTKVSSKPKKNLNGATTGSSSSR